MQSKIITLDNDINPTFTDIERLREIKQRIKTLEAEKDLVEKNLKNGFFKHETTFIYHGKMLATCQEEIKNILDSTALKKELPDIYATYLKKSISKPIRLK